MVRNRHRLSVRLRIIDGIHFRIRISIHFRIRIRIRVRVRVRVGLHQRLFNLYHHLQLRCCEIQGTNSEKYREYILAVFYCDTQGTNSAKGAYGLGFG